MARRRRRDEELEQEENLEALQNDTAEDAYEEDAYNDDAYDDGSYDDGYDDGYDDEYDGDPYDDYEDDEEEEGAGSSYRNDIPTGFLATKKGKILVAVIAVLMLVIIGLLVASFVLSRRAADNGGGEIQDLPGATAAVATQAPNAVVFLPGSQPTAEPVQSIVQPVQPAEQQPTQAPVVVVTPQPQVITPEPTNTPAPTATPLPIILTNTPTPSPSPTPSPTPTPTPTPTPSPKPSATPRVDLAAGEANREAKLRENPSSGAKVKLTLKKGEELTIHEAVLDKDGKVWYSVSVNDRDTQGWMRDYVVDVEGEIAAPTATPAVTATPKPGSEAAADSQTPAPEQTIGIGSGKTNNDTNVRKIMNGKVLTQLRKGKAVHILDAKLDKNGNLWYEIQVKGQTTKGFVRDYLITLDKGVTIPVPTATPAVSDAPADGGEAEAELPANLLDREVVGHAQANRSANVRQEPKAGAKVVVQLKKGTDVMILGMYAEGSNIWYEVATENGETHGFARDYVLDIITLNDGLAVSEYAAPEAPANADAE